MRDFKQMKEFDKKQEAEMLRVAESTLQNLPANVAINCWTTSLVVLEINRSSVLRLNIVHKIGKEPILRIEKDAHFLNAEQESLKKMSVYRCHSVYWRPTSRVKSKCAPAFGTTFGSVLELTARLF